ncbi:hypothetical protein M8J77_010571 [Diaphorina citri]|nr:hypothetical protein M8J77_010571 [Diaphorina citri]
MKKGKESRGRKERIGKWEKEKEEENEKKKKKKKKGEEEKKKEEKKKGEEEEEEKKKEEEEEKERPATHTQTDPRLTDLGGLGLSEGLCMSGGHRL